MTYNELKRLIVGAPLASERLTHERIPKWKALAVLSSDALSSVAYATEEILIPLAAFTTAAVAWSLPIALTIAGLLVIVTLSYRQTIDSYPNGGGAYIVAKENLGTKAGLIAAAALLIDYVLTVAVSVAAGVENMTSAVPSLLEHKEAIGLVVISILMVLNLRGVRESASIFAVPTYMFIFSFFVLIVVGAYRLLRGDPMPVAPVFHETYPSIPLFLGLKAFSSGCAALTGIEAISNGIPLFQDPKQTNAKVTMAWMSFILGSFFIGITVLAHLYGVIPKEGETAVSLLARAVFANSWFYYFIQFATASILVLAANTSYADFPRLSSLLAKDRFLPIQLASLGDRLVFSNGIIGLSATAMFLIIMFKGETHALIPLYAIGVFLSFTLSQAGMVLHHLREREFHWKKSLFFNVLGAIATFSVLIVIASTKFTSGAWMVVVIIPLIVFLFTRVYNHYFKVNSELALTGDVTENFKPIHQKVVIPISGIHKGVINALRYARSIAKSEDIRACYVDLEVEATEKMREQWRKWAPDIQLVILESPYRSVVGPLLRYVDEIGKTTENDMVTVLIPEFVTAKWWHQFLHNQTALLIKTALMFRRGKVVTSVRYHLRSS
jgi:amino acid transporter